MDSIITSTKDQAKRLIADTEHLLDVAAVKLGAGGNDIARRLKRVKDSVADVEREFIHKGRRTIRRVDHYAYENPWRVVGAGVVGAFFVGVLVGSALIRRDR